MSLINYPSLFMTAIGQLKRSSYFLKDFRSKFIFYQGMGSEIGAKSLNSSELVKLEKMFNNIIPPFI
jgi:hypothetical protein